MNKIFFNLKKIFLRNYGLLQWTNNNNTNNNNNNKIKITLNFQTYNKKVCLIGILIVVINVNTISYISRLIVILFIFSNEYKVFSTL